MPTLQIHPIKAVVRTGEAFTFKALVDGKETSGVQWTLNPPTAGAISSGGSFSAAKSPPQPVITVRATLPSVGVAEATVEFELPWPEHWPVLADDEIPWSDEQGRRAARILYDLLRQLPERFVKDCNRVRIVRVDIPHPDSAGLHTAFPFFRAEVDKEVVNQLNVGAPGVDDQDRYMAYVFLHELAHVVVSNRCGGQLGRVLTTVDFWLDLVRGGLGTVGAVCVLPALPVFLLMTIPSAFVDQATNRDFLSGYADVSDWSINNISALQIPLLGLLLFHTWRVAPNCSSGLRAFGEIVGLRNNQIGKLEEPIDDVPRFGMASRYAESDPHEDFAEAVAAYGLGTSQLSQMKTPFGGAWKYGPINDLRRDYLVKAELFPEPAKWTPVQVGGQLGTLNDWRVSLRTTALAPQSGEAVSAARAARIIEGLREWEVGPGRLLERNREVLSRLRIPVTRPHTVDFLRAAELHGDGVRLYTGYEHPLEPGDLLVGMDHQVWMATRTDEKGRMLEMTGAVEVTPETKPAELTRSRDALAFAWRPTAEPRRWCAEGEEGSPGYANLDEALTRLVQLWGETRAPASQRSLERAGGFLHEVLDAAGVRDEEFPLAAAPDMRDVLAYCDTHGGGLEPYAPGSTRVRVGDVVIPYHRNTVGVVTRVSPEGAPVDVLMGGTHEVGRVGEPAKAVKLLHGVEPWDIHQLWRPARAPRRWAEEGSAMSQVFQELNLALNHLVAHQGVKEVRRGEATHTVRHTGSLPVMLNLMLERGSSLESRHAFAPLALGQADDRRVRSHFYLWGSPSARGSTRPGDFVLWRRTGERLFAVVLEVDSEGAPVKLIGGEERLQIFETRVPREDLIESWTPSMERRAISSGSPMADFYGNPSPLFDAIERWGRQSGLVTANNYRTYVLGGSNHTLSDGDTTDVLQSLALNTPDWIRERLWRALNLDQLRAALDTLGEGVRPYAAGTPLPLGTWVFLEPGAAGAVISTALDGIPAMVLMAGSDRLAFRPVTDADIREYWLPSILPFRYVEDGSSAVFTDLNGFIGSARLRREESTLGLLFQGEALLRDRWLHPEIARILKQGPERQAQWPEYLKAHGTLVTGDPRPGDFLLLKNDGQGIALDRGEMISRIDAKVRLRPIANVEQCWRLTPAEAPAS